MAKDTRLYIRVNEKLKEELQRRADIENRTLSNYVLTILQKTIESEKKEEFKTGKEVLRKAEEIMEGVYEQDLPQVEVGEEVTLSEVWDGEGEMPEDSYSYQISETGWINYEFVVIQEQENELETVVKITNIEII